MARHSLLRTVLAATGAVAVALGLSACGSDSGSDKPLRVATDTAFVPFEFKEGDKYVGFDIDLWDAISEKAGFEYELAPMDFNGILTSLQTGQADVGIAGITITDERKQTVDFSDGYYDSGFLVMVPADSDIKGVEDLGGKTVAMKTGTAAADWAKANLPDTEARLFPNIDNAYLELEAGGVDAAMHDSPNVLYYIKENGEGRVKAVGETQMAQQYGIAFAKGSEHVEPVNTALAELKSDGTYEEIYVKWFGEAPRG